MVTVPHELIHKGTNILTGGENERIVINSIYGGSIASKVFSGIESEMLFPLIGGYISIGEYGSNLGEFAT